MRFLSFAALVIGVFFGHQAAAQSDLAICQAATPQFPQACPCVIQRAQGQGLTGPTLSRLLANDVAGLPIEAVQAYGAVYVQCIQEAVLAGVPSAPTAPPPPVAATPAPAPQPAPSVVVAPPAANPAPTILGRVYPGYRDGAQMEMALRDPVPPGQWNFVGLGYPGIGLGGPGTHDGRGNLVQIRCGRVDFSGGALVLGGPDAAALGPFVTVLVRRGNGAELYRRDWPVHYVEGGLAMVRNEQPMVDAIRAGAQLIVASRDGGRELIFGLSGSNDAIGPGVCGGFNGDFQRYSVLWPFVGDVTWEIGSTTDPLNPTLVGFDTGLAMLPRLGFTCDNRVRLGSPVFRYAQPGQGWDGSMVLYLEDGTQMDVPIRFGADAFTESPLAQPVIEALARTSVLEVTFVLDVEPGEFTTALYSAEGLAETMASHSCPERAEIAATARTDLTGQGAWSGVDVGRLFNGMVDNPPVVPAAVFGGPLAAEAPGLFVECTGEPFLMAGEWGPGVGAPLRFVFDGDLNTAVELDFFVARAQMFGGPEAEVLMQPMLTAQNVRITSRSDPNIDVLYPLPGLTEALRAAGCS